MQIAREMALHGEYPGSVCVDHDPLPPPFVRPEPQSTFAGGKSSSSSSESDGDDDYDSRRKRKKKPKHYTGDDVPNMKNGRGGRGAPSAVVAQVAPQTQHPIVSGFYPQLPAYGVPTMSAGYPLPPPTFGSAAAAAESAPIGPIGPPPPPNY